MEKLEIGNFCCFILDILIFMPPTLKKLWSILVSACLSIRCYKLGLSGFVFVPNTFMWLNGFVWLVRLHHFYAPNFEKVGDILVSACSCVCVCVCVCVYVCVCVCAYGATRYHLETLCMDSSWNNSRHIFFLELSPLVKLRPFEKNQNENF